MESIKLAKYVPDGNIIHILEAKNGLSCDCICIECGGKLVAVQGQVREKHFRHYDETNCLGGQETALHKLAKRIIVESSEIHIPEQGKINYSEAVEEQQLGAFRPDVTAITNGEPIYFEVVVTHRIDESKWAFYAQGQHKSLEIDIEHLLFEGIPSLEEIRQIIIEDIACKQVIFWKKEKEPPMPLVDGGEIKQTLPTTFWGGLLLLIALVLPFIFSERRRHQSKQYSKRQFRRKRYY